MESLGYVEANNSNIPPFMIRESDQNSIKSYAYILQKEKVTDQALLDDEQSQYDGIEATEEEYWQKYYDMPGVQLEWNDGVLEEKPMPDRLSYEMYEWFLMLIKEYIETFNEGILIGLELGFKLVTKHGASIRKPDLAFIHKDNPIQMGHLERTYRGCFDICFEFLSDSNLQVIERDTVIKKQIYEGGGVKEYYILDRLGNETTFYSLNHNGVYQKIKPCKSGIIRSKVLKNFQFRLEDLYARPSLIDLVDDHVYRNYVRLDYQAEKQRADSKEKEAEVQRKEAILQRKRADSLEHELFELKQRYGMFEK